jgi:hypothetical protein
MIDLSGIDGELARLVDLALARIADIVRAIDELLFERLAEPQLERPGKDAREDPLAFTVQLLIDEPRVSRSNARRRTTGRRRTRRRAGMHYRRFQSGRRRRDRRVGGWC